MHCPFIRETFSVNKDDWKKYGRKLQLRSPKVYLVVNEINPGYEWVIDDPNTFAVEKLDGTNIKLKTENGRLVSLMNRKNVIDPLQIIKGKTFIIEGVFRAIQKGYIDKDGIQAGELIGPKLQGNPYELNNHIFYPFSKAIKHLKYRSFDEHDRNFDNWESWFKDWLVSRFHSKRKMKVDSKKFKQGIMAYNYKTKGKQDDKVFAEGIVLYNLKRKSEGKTYMAKLRRDMFSFYYEDKIKIYDYKK